MIDKRRACTKQFVKNNLITWEFVARITISESYEKEIQKVGLIFSLWQLNFSWLIYHDLNTFSFFPSYSHSAFYHNQLLPPPIRWLHPATPPVYGMTMHNWKETERVLNVKTEVIPRFAIFHSSRQFCFDVARTSPHKRTQRTNISRTAFTLSIWIFTRISENTLLIPIKAHPEKEEALTLGRKYLFCIQIYFRNIRVFFTPLEN